MPTVSIEMFEGRTQQQKQDLALRITDAIVEVLAVDPNLVRIKYYELCRSDSAVGGILGSPDVRA